MDLHYRKETTVGALVILGVALFVAGTMWLKGTSLSKAKRTLTVQFADASGLRPNSEVILSGTKAGRVSKVVFLSYGHVVVTADLTIDVPLHTDASAVVSSPLLGNESSLVLNPGSSTAPLLGDNAEIRGTIESGLMAKGAALADRADTVLLGIQAVANQKTADDLHATLVAMQKTLNILSTSLPATTGQATKSLAALQHLTERLDTLLASPGIKQTAGHFDTLTTNLSAMTAQFTTTGARLDSLMSLVLKGQGTLGRLATDSGLYFDTRSTVQSLKGLIDTLQKHPGKIAITVKMF